jgi:hypothetical protein
MKRLLAVVVLLLTAACASTPPGPPPFNPVGTFEFETTVNGGPVTGSVEVTGQEDAYGGTVRTSVTPDMPIAGVAVEGNLMVVTADTPDGPVTLRMSFTGNDFTGRWELAGDSGTLTGRRRVP